MGSPSETGALKLKPHSKILAPFFANDLRNAVFFLMSGSPPETNGMIVHFPFNASKFFFILVSQKYSLPDWPGRESPGRESKTLNEI